MELRQRTDSFNFFDASQLIAAYEVSRQPGLIGKRLIKWKESGVLNVARRCDKRFCFRGRNSRWPYANFYSACENLMPLHHVNNRAIMELLCQKRSSLPNQIFE